MSTEDRAAADIKPMEMFDLSHQLGIFDTFNASHHQPRNRFAAKLARELRDKIDALRIDPDNPDLKSAIAAMQIDEISEKRRELSKQLDRLDDDEKRIKSGRA